MGIYFFCALANLIRSLVSKGHAASQKNAPINALWNGKLQDARKNELMKQFYFYQRFYQINLFFPVHLDLK